MLFKISILAFVILGAFQSSESRRFKPLDKSPKRKMMHKMNGVKFFLKRFCSKEEYKLSSICQTFFKCKCGNDKDGLFQCFAQECLPGQDGADSFFCDSVKCKTAVESNEAEEDDCTLSACEKYNQTLDVGEAAICNKIKFWKAMKECKSKGKRRRSFRDECADQVCTDPSFKEECSLRVFLKRIKECRKNHPGREKTKEKNAKKKFANLVMHMTKLVIGWLSERRSKIATRMKIAYRIFAKTKAATTITADFFTKRMEETWNARTSVLNNNLFLIFFQLALFWLCFW